LQQSWVLVHTTSGWVIGGYAAALWNSSVNYYQSPNNESFLFALKNSNDSELMKFPKLSSKEMAQSSVGILTGDLSLAQVSFASQITPTQILIQNAERMLVIGTTCMVLLDCQKPIGIYEVFSVQ
jgi:hypothetical protein